MKPSVLRNAIVTGLVAFGLALPVLAQDLGEIDKESVAKAFKKPGYSPYAGRNFPSRPLFGDTHLHTAISLDAGAVGATVGPDVAYRFARGEEVTTSTGQLAKLSRPLDFLVVSDHAEAFGSMVEVVKANPTLMANPAIKRWYDMIKEGGDTALNAAWELIGTLSDPSKMPAEFKDPSFIRSIWEPYVKTADRFNEPGKFTAFIGYEWSSQPGGDNLHRVVIFRDGADKAIRTLPFSAIDSSNPEDLWGVLAAYEEKTGGRVLAVPHNGNVSGGRMFALADFAGNPLTRKYAESRARWEPLLEVTQQKGDSESHKFLSPNDEFAGYEAWDKMNLGGTKLHQDSYFQGEYARAALKNGLRLEQQLGANPFKFGMIGSTDSHTGISAVEEENFFAKGPPYEPSADRTDHVFTKSGDRKVMSWELAASGYAAVWATENTREAIWDAMKRKEVYATTGPRMVVRFFGGWDFEAGDAYNRLPASVGYSKGVPMGGDLHAAPKGKAPTFLVAALKDPIGANLDRIQIVKGWLDAKGEVQEKVYDVAWGDADKRQPGRDGKLPSVGNTVDVQNALWTNTIGDPELIQVWKDPAFDPQQKAFYYARVIEIPTPRWTAYDAKYYGVKMPKEVPMTTQERAYTSPIWYTP
ncbi:MAG: DUF3604 domain-containing protein [Gammaproteobacteria bacterium]|nr:MAG: DUF3604 domain-containing protein [Gammaproteobacteria bacterium]